MFQSQGVISGTITGISGDGQKLDESFSYDQFTTYANSSNFFRNSDKIYFTVGRFSLSNEQSNIQLSFSRTSSGQILSPQIRLLYSKQLDGSKELNYSINTPANIIVTSFDETTGKLAGTYNATIEKSNNSVKNISTLDGKFDVVVRESIK